MTWVRLGFPTFFCHELVVDAEGRITGYTLRQQDQKRKAVEALRSLNFGIIAAGDSYNDISMIQAADHGIMFRPAEAFVRDYPGYPVVTTHEALRAEITRLLA